MGEGWVGVEVGVVGLGGDNNNNNFNLHCHYFLPPWPEESKDLKKSEIICF